MLVLVELVVVLRSSELVRRKFIMICIPSLFWVMRVLLLPLLREIFGIRITKNRSLILLLLSLILTLLWCKLIIAQRSWLVLRIATSSISISSCLLLFRLFVKILCLVLMISSSVFLR